jgi:tryptophan halogenase
VFIIPLQNRTSYGYVYNAKLNDPEEITADLRAMMEAEGAPPIGSPKHLRFPNFVRKRALEGRIFRFGNSFSFIEPLEATAIGLHTVNIAQALHFPMGRWTKRFQRLPFTSSYEKNKLVKDVQLLNRWLFRESLRASVFVAWHYSQGSKYQTPFWKNAKRAFEEGATTFPEPDLWAEMMDYIEAAKDFSSVEQFVQRMKADSGHPFSPFVDKPRKYCQWHLPSFIELFHGLGG